ncbi:MAG: hypothetical protein FWE14_08570 [Lachnospiraceae bacterium]|nr:hypothetical protein [Lachnospiraceae bacterium]
MDNFIDRITNRFSGQEVIKANAEAEAQEMRKLRSQAEHTQRALAQYETCMQEMRKLNLRNTESAKAVAELIENARVVLKAVKSIEIAEKEDKSGEIISGINEKIAALSGQITETDGKIAAIIDKINATDGNIAAITDKINATDGILNEVRDFIGKDNSAYDSLKNDLESAVHKENVKVYRNVQAALIEETGKQTDTIKENFSKLKGFDKPIFILVIVSLLVGLGNLGLIIVQLLGIL